MKISKKIVAFPLMLIMLVQILFVNGMVVFAEPNEFQTSYNASDWLGATVVTKKHCEESWGEEAYDEIYTYNSKGFITKMVEKTAKSTRYTREYTYDEKNNLKKETFIDPDCSVTTTNTYNKNNNLVSFIKKDTYGDYEKCNYKYDNEGRVIGFDIDTSVDRTSRIYEYDSKNRVSKDTIIYPDGYTVVSKLSYDSKDRLVKHIINYSNLFKDTFIYTYDEVGNLVKENGYFNNTYTYDKNNRVIKKVYKNGTVTYKYDQFGNVIEEKDTYQVEGEGSHSDVTKYTYTYKKLPSNVCLIDKKIHLEYASTTYNGKAKEPKVVIDGYNKGTDYTVSYSNNVKAGKGKILISFIGYKQPNVTITFDIKPCKHSSTSETVKKATTKINGEKVSTCKACGTVTKRTPIKKINSVTISKSSYTYDGNYKKPTVTVKNAAGTKLSSSNYTVKYSNNKAVGKATVTVTMKGNYSGTIKKTFNINPKGTSMSTLTATKGGFKATWKKQATQTTGYILQYSTSSSFSNYKYVTLGSTKTLSKAISGLSKGKKYYVRVRTYKVVNGTKYYSGWSSKMTVTTKK